MGFVNKYYSTFQNIVAATWGEPHKFPFETSERSEKATQPSGGCCHGSAHSVDGRASRVWKNPVFYAKSFISLDKKF